MTLKEQFLKDIDNWSNHRILLWQALERSSDETTRVIEMGCGDGSTPFLQLYCDEVSNMQLLSYDNNEQWADKFGSFFVRDWDEIMESWIGADPAVVLIDHAPGEHRRKALQFFIDHPELFEIIVIHDSEPAGHNASDYQVRELFSNFKYVKDLEDPAPKAWATVLSNTIDVTKFDINYPSVETTA